MQRGKIYIGDKTGNIWEGKITSALPASPHGVNTMIAWTSASQPYPMIIQKTYRLEKFIESVLSVECMSQPPALRATSFQRKAGKIFRSSSSWSLSSLQSLLFFSSLFHIRFHVFCELRGDGAVDDTARNDDGVDLLGFGCFFYSGFEVVPDRFHNFIFLFRLSPKSANQFLRKH